MVPKISRLCKFASPVHFQRSIVSSLYLDWMVIILLHTDGMAENLSWCSD
jgi:hypothetical protein